MGRGIKFAARHWKKWAPFALNFIPGLGAAMSGSLGALGKVGSVASKSIGAGGGFKSGIFNSLKGLGQNMGGGLLGKVFSRGPKEPLVPQMNNPYDPYMGMGLNSSYSNYPMAQGVYQPRLASLGESDSFKSSLARVQREIFLEDQQMARWQQTRVNMLPWN